MSPIFYGMMNVRNEEEWIEDVVKAILPICDRVFIFDDHSIDRTPHICQGMGPRVRVYGSKFSSGIVDITRDKNFIYEKVLRHCGPEFLNQDSPYWVIAIDGDEVLMPGGAEELVKDVTKTEAPSIGFQVLYLWDRPDQVRVDRVYSNLVRPSVFQIINPAFKFRATSFGGNCHCPNVPPDLIHNFYTSNAKLKHFGYLRKEQRLAKWRHYNLVDPNNEVEDYYRHIVQGDVEEVPVDMVCKHAGPMELAPLDSFV